MALINLVLWLIAALLSFLAGSLVLLLLSSSLLAFQALLVIRDFLVLKERLAAFLGEDAGYEAVSAQNSILFSGLGDKIISLLEALSYKVNTLSWKVRSETPAIRPTVLHEKIESSDYLSILLQNSAARFRCKAAALVMYDERLQSEESIRVVLSGLKGSQRHFERHLVNLFKPYFVEAIQEDCLKLLDLSTHKGSFANLTLFGLRYSVAFPLFVSKSSSQQNGVLWFGYDSVCGPLEEEIKFAKSEALQLGREISALLTLETLSKKAQNAQKSERGKDEFIAHMSHDIRSPLNNIRAILNVLRLERLDTSADEMLDVALHNCDNLSELVSGILDFSRHRAGKLEAQPELFDLTQVALEVFESFRVSAKLKKIDLRFDNIPESCWAYADKRQIKRVVQNVLGNAIKFTNGGWVRLSITRANAQNFNLRIQDSGQGMNQDQLRSLFVPFQAQAQSGQRQEGIGLGLALSKVLIELNGGSIGAQSRLGSGSIFELAIPAASAEQSQAANFEAINAVRRDFFDAQQNLLREKTSSISLGAGSDYKPKILVVDDDADCVDSLARILNAEGFDAVKAYSTSDATSILNFTAVDLVLCDSSMPDGGAKKVLQYIQKSARQVPLAVLSGHQDETLRAQFLALGAQEVWVKPFEMEKLRNLWLKNLVSGTVPTQGQDKVA